MTPVVAAARHWIGTPYLHQASCKYGGCDCLGLIRGVWNELLGELPAEIPAYTADWGEAGRDEILLRAARHWLCACPDHHVIPGRVILFRMRDNGVAKHLGIVGQGDPSPSFVHAYSRRGVVESPLTEPWRRRIVALFDFPKPVGSEGDM
ncbi:peptidase [Palleronia caenipelagi]|uniref:Peptidase n=1 Tax=Palleronia caenipelagi TaxID=2489174 RepID=A0A547Q074_9RHOB|nr:peptidase [Palleronia caenipelagi]TRD19769.1 peptidase [Palleronia caenipelagi]